MAYDVFISYRRETGADDARLLQQALKARGYNVFFDYDSLRDGKFDQKIFDAIDEARVFILMLTKGALDKCINEDDWVRQEIERAIEKQRVIVPVQSSSRSFKYPDQLPDSIKTIRNIQNSELNKESLFEESVNKIITDRFPKGLLATPLPAEPRTFGERLMKSLDEELDGRQFRAIAGLEFHDCDGNVSLTAHAVGSPWGVYILGFNDNLSEGISGQKIVLPSARQVSAYMEKTAVATELRPDQIKFLFVVQEPSLTKLKASRKRLPKSVRSESGIAHEFRSHKFDPHVIDWEKHQWDITRRIESLPMTHWGREANIIKHFKAKTVIEVEAGAALLAWVENPSEKLLDAAELACYYLRENGCRRAAEGVKAWLRVIADRGNVLAMDHYGWLLDGSDGEQKDCGQDDGKMANTLDKERVWWFKKGAELGGAHAQNSLGYCLQTGKGVKQDRVEAFRMFEASAAQGNRFGECSLADLRGKHADPAFLAQDWGEAFRLYSLSAKQNLHWAQYHLGECYEYGRGTVKDLGEARRWYEKAAQQGNQQAIDALKRNVWAAH